MRILCSNDDGIHAPGMAILEDIAREISDDVWTVAPLVEQSGASRAMSLHDPIRITAFEERRHAVAGTPSDAVMMGVSHIMKDCKPDLILSGVNNGQNVAEDLTYSGTVAAALKGMVLGVPSIALSQSRFNRANVRWQTARQGAPDIIRTLLAQGWPENVIININFPDVEPDEVAGIEVTRQGQRDVMSLYSEERKDLRGGRYHWFGFRGRQSNPPEGTDLRAIYDGRVSITPVHLELTHAATREALSGVKWT
ncbi:MAG: 5'/3'-nucleotidase SurE [Pseudomonadota bacterium]